MFDQQQYLPDRLLFILCNAMMRSALFFKLAITQTIFVLICPNLIFIRLIFVKVEEKKHQQQKLV